MAPGSPSTVASRRISGGLAFGLVGLLMAVVLVAPTSGTRSGPGSAGPGAAPSAALVLSPGGDSLTYLTSSTRGAHNPNETVLNPSNAPSIKQLWVANVHSTVYSQPTVRNGTVYLPTWGGYLDTLNATSGAPIYSTFLGTQTGCFGKGTVGIASSPTLEGSTLYVGGAGGQWLAVSASNGSRLWSVTTGSPSLGFYNWASPLLVHGEEYVGLASSCDNPLVPGAVLAINTTTHAVDGRFNTTLNGSLGASVWSSPSYDPDLNEVFATTGNPSNNTSSMPYAESILAFQPPTLRLLGSWQVPTSTQVPDGDFGSTPTIVDIGRLHLVVALNKDGYVYAWNRSNLGAGPVWKLLVGASQHDIASASFDGRQLYVSVGSSIRLHGQWFQGSLWAIDPVTGRANWTDPLPSPAITSPYAANGLVVVEAGAHLYVARASDGRVLQSLSISTGRFINSPLISHGILFAGSSSGHLYAFGLTSSRSGGGHHHGFDGGLVDAPTAASRWV
jgi:outer membrane protein assembly factor BamB